MEPLELTATQFIKGMSWGRTQPLLLSCQNANSDSFEVVVKFRGREMNEKAQIAELVSAMFADDLGLRVPQPAIVNVPVAFDTIIPETELAELVKRSIGLNFGSVNIGAGFTTWPAGRDPHGAQRDQSAEIFAFDTLVQNPDRRVINPNLWSRTDCIGVYDHEQAFSFLHHPIIGGAPKPWQTSHQGQSFRFLEQHVFYRSLRGGRLDLGPFKEKLGRLSDKKIASYMQLVPADWKNNNDLCDQMLEYLKEARREREGLINFVKHVLR